MFNRATWTLSTKASANCSLVLLPTICDGGILRRLDLATTGPIFTTYNDTYLLLGCSFG